MLLALTTNLVCSSLSTESSQTAFSLKNLARASKQANPSVPIGMNWNENAD
jgi:hypothetical protein